MFENTPDAAEPHATLILVHSITRGGQEVKRYGCTACRTRWLFNANADIQWAKVDEDTD